MFASLLRDVAQWDYLLSYPWKLLVFAFQAWIFIDAARRKEWMWAVLIFIGWGFMAVWHCFHVYRAAPPARCLNFLSPQKHFSPTVRIA